MIKQSESITELAGAMANAQGEMGKAATSSTNPHFNSKYADLSEVLDTVLPPLNKHGIALLQFVSTDNGLVCVTTRLVHKSGEWVECSASMAPTKPGPHAYGSCITYLRRYSAAAACGLTQADDDGNAGQGKPEVDTSEAEATLRKAAEKGYEEFGKAWQATDPAIRTAINQSKPKLIAELKAICQPEAA